MRRIEACGFFASIAAWIVSAWATGVWFEEQTADCLANAIEQFEQARDAFDPARLRTHALRFRTERFEDELFGFVASVVGKGEKRMAA